GRTGPRQAARARPRIEPLEDRLVPPHSFVSPLGVGHPPPRGPGTPLPPPPLPPQPAPRRPRPPRPPGPPRHPPPRAPPSPPLHINPAAILVYDKSLQIFGGFDDGFNTWAPSTFRTFLDGGSAVRGVYVLANRVDVSLDMEGFTVEACLGKAERNLDINAG